jgi:flagellar hook-length control protein FliK
VCFLIQPIVTVHTAKASAAKPTDRNGEITTPFYVLLQDSVEKEKDSEVSADVMGLLTQLFSNIPVMQTIGSTNPTLEFTENYNKQAANDEGTPSSPLIFQQDELQQLLKNGQQLQQPIHFQKMEVQDLNQTKPQLNGLDETFIDPTMEMVMKEVTESNSKEQLTKLVSIDHTLAGDSIQKENSLFTSTQHPFQGVQQNSIARPITNQPVNANQFNQDIVKFFQSAVSVQDLGDGMEAAFSLKPEHLGRVDVKVSIVDGTVTADFLASTQSGKELLETHMQTLRVALETQGFQVDKIHISQGSSSSLFGSFSQRGESNGRQTQSDSKKRQVQNVQNQETDYREFDIDSVSQINTTA